MAELVADMEVAVVEVANIEVVVAVEPVAERRAVPQVQLVAVEVRVVPEQG